VRLLALAFLAGCSPYVVAPGTPIRHDDFLFTVRAIRLQPPTKLKDRYVIDLDVENQAREVHYRWDDRTAYVRDERGHSYYAENPRELSITPGHTVRIRLKFALPHDLRTPHLRFWDGIFMGDVLNGVRYARAATALK